MVYIYHAPGNAASFGQTEVSKMASKRAAATQNRHLEYLSFPEGRNITSACSKIGTRTPHNRQSNEVEPRNAGSSPAAGPQHDHQHLRRLCQINRPV